MTTATATQFFFDYAGYSYDPKTETENRGRLRCAETLAAAEEWSEQQQEEGNLRVDWVEDVDYDPEYAAPVWGCLLYRWGKGKWSIVASLWGITFGGDGYPDGDPYKRVVEAELAAELLAEQGISQ